jgi:hypothetical protein
VGLCKQAFLFFLPVGVVGQFGDFGPGDHEGIVIEGFFGAVFTFADGIEAVSLGAGFFAASAAQSRGNGGVVAAPCSVPLLKRRINCWVHSQTVRRLSLVGAHWWGYSSRFSSLTFPDLDKFNINPHLSP